ncbi:putative glycosyl transferase [Commensalibacter intestini A911]|uniref:Glycosyl transferase n=2 Tax=Commensalibacter intestini TaxID=479936 RepID=A0A251ZVG0_9PROT|nr:glycosyltransferase family 2 protein [Commensalibacter intestini]EHD13337.1 putative glycosyl transferase [Commensalibacter intestini A911]OUI78660.1 glycosyl transferase [Commensalibacter intestini]
MTPVISIVVTVLNEAENIIPVCREIASVLSGLPDCEVIFVDDGSTDKTLNQLSDVKKTFLPSLVILSHNHRCGKSAALLTAIEAAQGQWVTTMDGDGQDDPKEIISMWEKSQQHAGREPLVVGVRLKRNDNFSRRFATTFANGLRRYLLKDGCVDTGAPMKLFLRDDFMKLPHFEGLHRFLPALLGHYGVPLVCHEVHHRQRLNGVSKYTNLNRAIVGIRDMLGVIWLLNRIRLPKKITKY